MPIVNRIRLPVKLKAPQFLEQREVFRKSNGVTKVLSVVIQKQYLGETDLLPEKLHERIKIALSHDTVNIEGERYVGGVVQDGDYTIEWVEFLDFPIAKANFKVNVTPFDASNTNCGTCEDFTQVVCEDDDLGTVGEDQDHSVPVLDNDAICCYPFEISLITFNSDYLDSCVINGNNIDIHTKTGLTSQDDVVLVTYRVTCEGGLYDEANIIADIEGTLEPACAQPSFIDAGIGADGPGTAAPNWGAVVPDPVGYNYALYLLPDNVTPIDSGTTTAISVLYNPLAPGDYLFTVITDCGEGNLAAPLSIEFTMAEQSIDCGNYRLQVVGFPLTQSATYIDCNGDYQTVIYNSSAPRFICAAQYSPGLPYSIQPSGPTVITYIDEC